MGEDIEIRDVNGNLVRVPLYPTLSAIGDTIEDDQTRCCGRRDGRLVEVRLIPLPAENGPPPPEDG